MIGRDGGGYPAGCGSEKKANSMRKKILVVGGSYFVGRVFVRMAARMGVYDIAALNRGNRPLGIDGVEEIVCDRHDAEKLAAVLPATDWDAVVDFCAYAPGEAETLLRAVPGAVRQYVFISTCGVYDPDGKPPRAENSPLLARGGDDPGVAYGYGKVLLEREAKSACAEKKTAATIFRPTMIYGPLNYAPRESFYFERLLKDEPIPAPVDATGRFQFVYVKDVAKMIMAAFGNENAFGETFNLSAPERLDYDSYLDSLARVTGASPRTVPVTVAQAYAENIPLPFPLDSDMLYDGAKASERLGVRYTPFLDGMDETWDVYKQVHGAKGK